MKYLSLHTVMSAEGIIANPEVAVTMVAEPNRKELWQILYALKSTPRQGWLDRGIPALDAESVADHSLMTAMIAWVVACNDKALDASKVLQLALIHDAEEAIVGDLPPYDAGELPDPADTEAIRAFFSVRRMRTPENAAQKREAEAAASSVILNLLPDTPRDAWSALRQEYEAQESAEARFVKQVDRLEAFIQSRMYAERFPEAPVRGFTDMAMKEILHPELVRIRDAFLES